MLWFDSLKDSGVFFKFYFRERGREGNQFVVSLIYTYIDWFLYVAWLGSNPQPWLSGQWYNQLNYLARLKIILILLDSLQNILWGDIWEFDILILDYLSDF